MAEPSSVNIAKRSSTSFLEHWLIANDSPNSFNFKNGIQSITNKALYGDLHTTWQCLRHRIMKFCWQASLKKATVTWFNFAYIASDAFETSTIFVKQFIDLYLYNQPLTIFEDKTVYEKHFSYNKKEAFSYYLKTKTKLLKQWYAFLPTFYMPETRTNYINSIKRIVAITIFLFKQMC